MKLKYESFDTYVVLDLETTGLSADYDEIIEVTCLKVNNGIIVDEINTLIKPNAPINEFITELTGITNEMVKDAPQIEDVISSIFEMISNLPLLGQSLNFDVNFLKKYSNKFNYNFDETIYCDTMMLGRRVLKELKHHRLKDYIKYFKIDVENRHRSYSDCIATKISYENMIPLIPEGGFKKKHSYSINLNSLVGDSSLHDVDNLLYQKYIVFTGALERMVRKDAAQMVLNIGGYVENSVTKSTNYLVLGCNDYCKQIKDGKSSKQKKVEKLQLSGQDIGIITEKEFCILLNIDID